MELKYNVDLYLSTLRGEGKIRNSFAFAYIKGKLMEIDFIKNCRYKHLKFLNMETDFLSKLELNEVRKRLNNSFVSIVSSLNKSNNSKLSTFGFILENLNQFDQFKQLRGWKLSERKKEYEEIKQNKIPSFTLTSWVNSGFSVGEAKEIKNPFIIIDIDKKYLCETDSEEFRQINSFPFVVGSSVSISGCGYWSVVEFNEQIKTQKDFSEMFRQLKEFYLNEGIELDKSCCNINRLRVISPYEFIYNDDYCQQFEIDQSKIISKKQKKTYNENYVLNEIDCPYIEEYKEGQMYEVRYRWANTLYNCFGEDGYSYYRKILSKDQASDEELDGIWKTASKGDQSSYKRYIELLKVIGLIKL